MPRFFLGRQFSIPDELFLQPLLKLVLDNAIWLVSYANLSDDRPFSLSMDVVQAYV